MDTVGVDFGQWLNLPEDDSGPAGSLDQGNDIIDVGHYPTYEQSLEQMMWSPLAEDAGASRPTQGMRTIDSSMFLYAEVLFHILLRTIYTCRLWFLPTQPGSLPFDAALRPAHAAKFSTPLSSGLWATNVLLWPHGRPVTELHQSSSARLGIVDLSRPAGSGLSTERICAPQIHSAVTWVSCSQAGVFGFTELTRCT